MVTDWIPVNLGCVMMPTTNSRAYAVLHVLSKHHHHYQRQQQILLLLLQQKIQ